MTHTIKKSTTMLSAALRTSLGIIIFKNMQQLKDNVSVYKVYNMSTVQPGTQPVTSMSTSWPPLTSCLCGLPTSWLEPGAPPGQILVCHCFPCRAQVPPTSTLAS